MAKCCQINFRKVPGCTTSHLKYKRRNQVRNGPGPGLGLNMNGELAKLEIFTCFIIQNISLVYTLNNKGARLEPCGTPTSMSCHELKEELFLFFVCIWISKSELELKHCDQNHKHAF